VTVRRDGGRSQMRHATGEAGTKRQRGFTLTELFAVVAVAAVLAAVAMPNLAEFIKNNARSTRLNNLIAAMNYARGDSVTRRRLAKVCASTDNTNCSGTRFDLGYLVMTSPNVAPPVWSIQRRFPPESTGSATFTGNVTEVMFLPTGLMSGAAADTHFTYCDDRGLEAARAVLLSATGHPRVSEDGDGDGTHEYADGAALTCP